MNTDGLQKHLPGTWHIQATNFPMWLSGKRRQPTFTYRLLDETNGQLRFDDDVSYVNQHDTRKHIRGIDTFDNEKQLFIWRGRGWLKLFTSQWAVIYMSPDRSVAVIRFSKSLVTPAGIDIITRDEQIDDLRAHMDAQPAAFGIDATIAQTLTWLA